MVKWKKYAQAGARVAYKVGANALKRYIQHQAAQAMRKPSAKRKGSFTVTDKEGNVVYKRTAQRYGAGKSAGRFRVRRPIRRLRRHKKALTRGVEQVREAVGSNITALYNMYIGHCSQPVNMLKDLIWTSIAKLMVEKMGGQVTSSTAPVTILSAGSIFTITYRTSPASGVFATTSYSIPALTTGTISSLGTGLKNAWESVPPDNECMLFAIHTDSTVNPVRIELGDALIKVWAKSSLKIQNRSYGSGGDEADDVDNVPLYGKSYEFQGNGAIFKGSSTSASDGPYTPMFPDNTSGGYYLPITTNSDLSEPPSPNSFIGCRKFGKCRLEPGNIKTSVLYDSYTIGLQKLIGAVGTQSVNPTKNLVGKFRLFSLEKIIETANPPVIPIRTAYEINNRMSVEVIPRATFTRSMFVPMTI